MFKKISTFGSHIFSNGIHRINTIFRRNISK